jgi:hypothetical protein
VSAYQFAEVASTAVLRVAQSPILSKPNSHIWQSQSIFMLIFGSLKVHIANLKFAQKYLKRLQ